MNEEECGVDVAVFRQGEPNMVNRYESIVVWAADRNEAAENARNEVGRGDEWGKVIRVWKKRR